MGVEFVEISKRINRREIRDREYVRQNFVPENFPDIHNVKSRRDALARYYGLDVNPTSEQDQARDERRQNKSSSRRDGGGGGGTAAPPIASGGGGGGGGAAAHTIADSPIASGGGGLQRTRKEVPKTVPSFSRSPFLNESVVPLPFRYIYRRYKAIQTKINTHYEGITQEEKRSDTDYVQERISLASNRIEIMFIKNTLEPLRKDLQKWFKNNPF